MTQQLALQIATRAHKGQVDKLGNDYILHPVRIAAQFSDDADARIVALLHDVIEDTIGKPLGERVTEDDLRKLFTSTIVDAVVAITHTKEESRQTYYDRVKANHLALKVKLADLADNVNRLDQLTDEATRQRLTEKYRFAEQCLTNCHRQ